MITYRLSNRQQKELLIRGQTVQIAIPCIVDCDAMRFARDSLPEHASYVTFAEHASVVTWLGVLTGGLANMLGQIKHDDDDPDRLGTIPAAIEVVVATLSPPNPRGRAPLIQWPSRAFQNGVEIEAKTSRED